MFNASLDGLLTGLSLIIAIGAQNAYLLRQGLRRAYVGRVVAVCTVSDFALILAGVSGIGVIVRHAGWALSAVRWFGVVFLAWYGLSSAWRARHPAGLAAAGGEPGEGGAVLRRIMALTWLNPHVYLDTVVLLGALANEHRDERWLFGVGAVTASAVWFVSLGLGARRLAGLFATPMTWRILDGLIAVMMIALGLSLALS